MPSNLHMFHTHRYSVLTPDRAYHVSRHIVDSFMELRLLQTLPQTLRQTLKAARETLCMVVQIWIAGNITAYKSECKVVADGDSNHESIRVLTCTLHLVLRWMYLILSPP